ncbi:hypothetical protein D3C80_768950 [compost metagenome]
MEYNVQLADSRGLSEADKEELAQVYRKMGLTLRKPGNDAVARVEALEYRMQELWGFGRDRKFHRYQLEIKGCTCPKHDNRGLIGVAEWRYVNINCKWHGGGEDGL